MGGVSTRAALVEKSFAILRAAAHGRLGLTEIQAAAAAGRERAALGLVRGAGGGVAEGAPYVWRRERLNDGLRRSVRLQVRAVRLLKTDLCCYYDGWRARRTGPARRRRPANGPSHHSESLQHAEEGVIWFYFAQYHILRHNLRRIPTNPRARPEPAAPEHAQPPRPGRLDVVNAKSALQQFLARPHRFQSLGRIARA